MDPAVRKELDDMLMMVRAWADDKIITAGAEDGWEFLAQELSEEIDDHVCPYARRLVECKHITSEEHMDFMEACYANVNMLAEYLRPAEV